MLDGPQAERFRSSNSIGNYACGSIIFPRFKILRASGPCFTARMASTTLRPSSAFEVFLLFPARCPVARCGFRPSSVRVRTSDAENPGMRYFFWVVDVALQCAAKNVITDTTDNVRQQAICQLSLLVSMV
jgi:hypothetical protein